MIPLFKNSISRNFYHNIHSMQVFTSTTIFNRRQKKTQVARVGAQMRHGSWGARVHTQPFNALVALLNYCASIVMQGVH